MKTYSYMHILLILSLVVTEMATDIYTPALPILKDFFRTTEEAIQWTLSYNLLGIALSSCFYGPLSDSYGRKKIMLVGMIIFLISTGLCACASDIWTLIFLRFLQGIGAGAAWVIALAMVTDLYETEESLTILSILGISISVSPAIAPIIGGVISVFWGWQMNFVVIGLAALILLICLFIYLPETLPLSKRQPFSWNKLKENVSLLFHNKIFLGYTLISGGMFAALWAFIARSPFVLNFLGVSQFYFGFYIFLTIVCYGIGAFLNKFCIRYFHQKTLILFGLIISLIGGGCLWGITSCGPSSPLTLISIIGIYTFSMPFIFSNATSLALDAVDFSIGTASSIMSGIEMIMSAGMIALIARHCNQDFHDVSLCFIATSLVSTIIFATLYKKGSSQKQVGK